MSTQDPGWGDYVPLPDEQPPSRDPSSPSQASIPTGPGGAGDGTGRGKGFPRRLLIGLGVAAVVLAGLAILGFATKRSPHPPSTTATTVDASTTVQPSTISKADYISRADNICLSFKSQIQQATAASDVPTLANVGQAELDQLRRLPDPAQDSDLIGFFIDDVTQAVNFLIQNDIKRFNTKILAADTVASRFGMKVCNFGQ